MEHHIISEKTFRYFTKGNLTKAKKILIVFHGYGQLAEYFIRKFEKTPDDYFIVAPEGMHRFYLNGSSGRVGASWMTKEVREFDIQDNINWLNQLLAIFNIDQFEKISILGFSQGGATAARWSNQLKIKHQLILWACVFPPDLEPKKSIIKNELNEYHFVLGDDDEYFNQEQQKEVLSFYKFIGYNTHIFNGKHTIDIETVNQLID